MALRHPPSFADLLKTWRRAARLTQEELAERARVSTRAISDLERGAKRHPYRHTVQRIAEALALGAEQRALLETAARGPRDHAPANRDRRPHDSTLVGRSAEMERLSRHLGGEGAAVLLVRGEPGIGKSRLLREAAVVAEAQGLATLSGGCTRRSRHEPFAPLADALHGYLSAQPAGRQRELLKGASWIIRLFPEIADEIDLPTPLSGSTDERERRLLFASVNRFLAGTSPVGAALLLDDVQWAGPDALDLLAAIAEGAAETGVRVIAAYRGTEVQMGDELFALVSDLGERFLAEELEILPLAEADSAALLAGLVGADIPPDVQSHVLQRSGGVPFYLSSYAYSIAATGTGGPVPWTAAQSVRQRVAAVPASTRELLAAAALIGRTSPTWLLRRVVDLEESTLVEALECAGQAGLLHALDAQQYAFAHDVVRDVVEGDLSAARRQMVHQRIAHALESRPAAERQRHAAQLAWHLERAGEPERAVDYALQAGDAAARALAHGEAAEHFRSAAALAEGRDGAKQAEALVRLGSTYLLQGRLVEGAAVLEQAVSLRRALGDLEGEALAVAQLGWMHFYRGDADSIVPQVRRLVEALQPRGASRGLCSLYLLLTLVWFGPDPVAGLDAAERASAIALTLNDDALLVQAEVRRGLALGGVGRWAEGAAVLEAAMPLAEEIGDLTRLVEGLAFAGVAHADLGNLPRALDLYAQALQRAEQLGSPGHQAYALGARGSALFLAGRWQEAREHLSRAVELDRASETPAFSFTYALSLARIAVAEGRTEEADRYLDQAQALAPPDAQELVASRRAYLMAAQAFLAGKIAAARAIIVPYIQGMMTHVDDHVLAIPTVAEILWEAGDRAGATRLLEAVERVADPCGFAIARTDILRVRARLLACCAPAEAGDLFAQALCGAESIPCPQLQGRILRDWACASAQPQREERLQQALAIFQRLGAKPDAERTEMLLRQGSEPHVCGRSGGR